MISFCLYNIFRPEIKFYFRQIDRSETNWKPGSGFLKTYTLKNMYPGNNWIYTGLKSMSDFWELRFNKIYVSANKI